MSQCETCYWNNDWGRDNPSSHCENATADKCDEYPDAVECDGYKAS